MTEYSAGLFADLIVAAWVRRYGRKPLVRDTVESALESISKRGKPMSDLKKEVWFSEVWRNIVRMYGESEYPLGVVSLNEGASSRPSATAFQSLRYANSWIELIELSLKNACA